MNSNKSSHLLNILHMQSIVLSAYIKWALTYVECPCNINPHIGPENLAFFSPINMWENWSLEIENNLPKFSKPLSVITWPNALIHLVQKGFPGCRTFSSKTSTVLGKSGRLVTLHIVGFRLQILLNPKHVFLPSLNVSLLSCVMSIYTHYNDAEHSALYIIAQSQY